MLVSLMVTGLFLTGCAAPRVHTTFLNAADLVEMTDRMAQSLTHDPLIGERRPDDAPWVISIHRVTNHTNQIIPEREKWLYVGRLRALLAQTDLSAEHNIQWIVPPERWPLIVEELETPEAFPRDRPTHLLTATFEALTTTSGRGRTDAYLNSFQLLDLGSGMIVWEDAYEVKRSILGRMYD